MKYHYFQGLKKFSPYVSVCPLCVWGNCFHSFGNWLKYSFELDRNDGFIQVYWSFRIFDIT